MISKTQEWITKKTAASFSMEWMPSNYPLTLKINKKLVEISHMGIKGGSLLVDRLVDYVID